MPKDIVFDAKVTVEPGKPVEMPSGDFVANAEFTRDGHDLLLTSPEGQTIVIEGYFAQETQPDIVTADGAHLSPEMVDAFLPPQHAGQYAQVSAGTVSDVSPAGQITELTGSATIVRADGTRVEAAVGTPVYPGDVVETSADGAVNILFADNTTFAISESARLSIDEFTYNAADQEGTSFFSMLQGMFVYTSGLIGKSDPGNVNIETPVGSIGIRGTVVAGDINPAGEESKITIVDGAIVLTNQAGSVELNDAFETASLTGYNTAPVNMGQMDSSTFASSYQSVSTVASTTFTSVGASAPTAATSESAAPATQQESSAPASEAQPAPDAQTQPAEGTDAQTTQPADATQQPATGGEVAPPPPPPQFFMPPPPPPLPSGSDFGSGSTTAFTAPANTGGTTQPTTTIRADGTTTVLPPPPPSGDNTVVANPPPPPELGFMFSTLYTNYTPGNTADDGIDLFGGNRWFEGAIVGQADTRHLPSGTRFELVYTAPNEAPVTLTTSGEILGNAYGHMSLTATAPTLTDEGIFYFDATNGRITVLDPTAMNAALQGGNYNFRLVAIDANNNVIDDHSFMVRMQSWGGLVYTGTDGNDGNAAAATGGIILSNPNTAALAGAGDDHVMLASTGHKVQLGEGNDAATITGMNFGSVYGGAGEDRLVLGGSATDYNFISSPDVVRGVETIEFGGTGKSMRLNLQEIFEMTDGGAFALTIRTANTAITGNLFLDIDGLTVSGGTLDQSGTAVGSGNVTLQGMYNGQTVTLIIEQGNTSGGVVVNDV